MTIFITAIMSIITTTLMAAIGCHLYRYQQSQIAIISDLQSQLAVLCSGTVSTDERLVKFERTLARLREQQGSLSSSIAPQHNYDHAIRLAKKGVASNQLVDSCNLSDEEAHLIERIHGDKDPGAIH